MKKRLIISNVIVVFISLMALLVTVCFVTNNLNDKQNRNEIFNYLNIACNVFDGENFSETEKTLTMNNNQLRITIIDKEGNIVIDNFTAQNENHLSRPEIQHLGEVYYRYSDTLKLDMAYVAREDDGYYVRVAIPRDDLSSFVSTIILLGSISLIVILFIASSIIYLLSKNIYSPIVRELNKTRALIGEQEEIKGNDIEQISDDIMLINSSLREKIATIELENEKVDFILNHIQHGLVVIDSDGNIEMINDFAAKIFSFDISQILGKNYLYLSTDKEISNSIENVLKNKKGEAFDLSKEGKTYLLTIDPINEKWISNLNKYALVMLIVDVTSKREIETLKSEFFANASHELKSPLTSIIGYQQLISEGIITEKDEILDAVKNTIREARRMNSLIVEMLDLSRLELKEKKELKNIDIVSKVEDILKENSLLIGEKKLNIVREYSPCTLLINEGDVEKLLSNLITNAIKYNNENGKIVLNITNEHFKISDTGIGIPQDDLEKIFKRFYRVDKNKSKELGGTGLGLSIVKHVCKNYGFEIKVTSKLGQGSTFEIIFNNDK